MRKEIMGRMNEAEKLQEPCPVKNSSGHTPGPWKFYPVTADERRIMSPNINKGGNWHVATVQSCDADAHLMASAPEMYAALLECKWMLENLVTMNRIPANNQALRVTLAALAKAEAAAELERQSCNPSTPT